MTPRDYKLGDVVQLNEKTKNAAFVGCFMVVSEPKSFGAQGFVAIPGGVAANVVAFQGRAYYRATFDEMDFIGTTNLLPADEVEQEDAR